MLKACPWSQRTWPSSSRTGLAQTGQRRKAATAATAWRCAADIGAGGIGRSAVLLEHAVVDGEQRGLLVLGEALVALDRLLRLRDVHLPGGSGGSGAGRRVGRVRFGAARG